MNEIKLVACRTCNELLELTTENFYQGKANETGFLPHCKTCFKRRGKEARDKLKFKKESTMITDYNWAGSGGIYC